MTEQAKTTPTKEPSNTLYVQRWTDLDAPTDPAQFEITNDDGDSHVIRVDRKMRQILEVLDKRTIYCASRCRISHYVNLLRHEKRVEIETDRYSNDADSGRLSYGVFRLVSKVTRIDRQEVRS